MNERIKKLARQSGAYFGESGVLTNNIDLELFIELIVRECMEMSDELKAQYLARRKGKMDFGEKNIYAKGEAACDALKCKIKEHFGMNNE